MHDHFRMLVEKSKMFISTSTLNSQGENSTYNIELLNKKIRKARAEYHEYDRKEKQSKWYREIVKDYNETLAILHHKRQTLTLLNNQKDVDLSLFKKKVS